MLDDIFSEIKRMSNEGNGEASFQGVPVSQISNYKPWMNDAKLKDFYSVDDDGKGGKKVILSKDVTVDDVGFKHTDINGKEMDVVNESEWKKIFDLPISRFNDESEQLGQDKVNYIGQLKPYSMSELGVTVPVLNDYLKTVLDPDVSTEKIKVPAQVSGGIHVPVYSDMLRSLIGSTGGEASDLNMLNGIRNSVWNTVSSNKKVAETAAYQTQKKQAKFATEQEIAGIISDVSGTEGYKAIKGQMDKLLASGSNASENELRKRLLESWQEAEVNPDGTAKSKIKYPSDVVVNAAMQQGGYKQTTSLLSDYSLNGGGEATFTGYDSIVGTPYKSQYDGKYYISKDNGEIFEMNPNEINPELDKMAKQNGVLMGSGGFQRPSSEVGKYYGKVSIGMGGLTSPSPIKF